MVVGVVVITITLVYNLILCIDHQGQKWSINPRKYPERNSKLIRLPLLIYVPNPFLQNGILFQRRLGDWSFIVTTFVRFLFSDPSVLFSLTPLPCLPKIGKVRGLSDTVNQSKKKLFLICIPQRINTYPDLYLRDRPISGRSLSKVIPPSSPLICRNHLSTTGPRVVKHTMKFESFRKKCRYLIS